MSITEAMYQVFGPLSQGAPGNEAATLAALERITDRDQTRRVLDLGVGHGRSTLTLARALPDAQLTAVEIHPPFVEELGRKVADAGLADRVRVVCGAMEDYAAEEGTIDLVWAEGSIYVLGVERALSQWYGWLRPGGWVAFSDFVWWSDDPSAEVREFWASEYPQMASTEVICGRALAAGYRVQGNFRMSAAAHQAYYAPLETRLAELAPLCGGDDDLATVLAGARREVDVVRRYPDEAGYSFFVLQRTGD
jgi:predicted O-methyltransferase YrrM